jgi:serine protease AprX
MVLITINGNTLDPDAPVHARKTLGAAVDNAADSNYILIQTKEPLKKSQKEELANLKVGIKEYVSENTYLCYYEPEDLEPVRSLDYVAYSNIYPSMFVVNPSLKTAGAPGVHDGTAPLQTSMSSRTRTVDVVLHRDCKFEDCKSDIARVAHIDADDVKGCKGKVRLTLQERYLDDVAKIDNVQLIEEVHGNKLFNNVARRILKVENVTVNSTKLTGKGQIVAVGDTGVDSAHPAFKGRIKKAIALGRPGKTNDSDGHGTHVCGSVLGSDTLQGGGGPIQGTAPEAELVMQSLLDSQGGLGGIPDDLVNLFKPAYDLGARVHNNSWGSVTPGLAYDESCRELDQFVIDHPDMVICFAAGNDGVDRDRNGVIDLRQVGSQAVAKNILTIGASENDRPELTVAYGVRGGGGVDPRYSARPIFGDRYANNPDGMAAFSNRGLSREQRYKPDVVAPGTCILSARSSLVEDEEFYGRSPDPNYKFESGTSMACPLASGCAAVIRQFLVANPPSGVGSSYSPTAALVKAVIINGAVELPGQYSPSEAGPSPNPASGWGRISVQDSALVASATAGYGEGGPLEEDGTFDIDVNVSGGGNTLKVTLVWSDPPGAMLQNDLDLTVTAGGSERHGNMGSRPGFDRINNVEQVNWTNVPSGQAKITVSAFRLTSDSQSFAYAWKLV